MDGYGLYGKTVKKKLYDTDEKERYFHIYHSVTKEAAERTMFEEKLRKMKTYLLEHVNEEIEFGQIFQHYFYIHYEESTKVFVYPEERIDVTEKEIELCGYFVIVTSDKMTAKEAIRLYKSRDASEKLFSGDKTYLGNKSIRVHSDESASAKIFIEFVALIVRSRMYTNLLDEMKKMNKKPNYMTVPAAIRELEKIEMVRQTDNVYRLDHAVTATQKTILGAFGLNESHIKNRATEISNSLQKNKK